MTMTYFSDVLTEFGRFRGTRNWAILSRHKITEQNDLNLAAKERRQVAGAAARYWRMRPKTTRFRIPRPKFHYRKIEGHWFPTYQIIAVSRAVDADRCAVLVRKEVPILMVLGKSGRGIICAMNTNYVARVGGDKAMGEILFGED